MNQRATEFGPSRQRLGQAGGGNVVRKSPNEFPKKTQANHGPGVHAYCLCTYRRMDIRVSVALGGCSGQSTTGGGAFGGGTSGGSSNDSANGIGNTDASAASSGGWGSRSGSGSDGSSTSVSGGQNGGASQPRDGGSDQANGGKTTGPTGGSSPSPQFLPKGSGTCPTLPNGTATFLGPPLHL